MCAPTSRGADCYALATPPAWDVLHSPLGPHLITSIPAVRSQIRLANNTWFTVRYLAFSNMRRRVNLGQAPGMDIFVPLPPNERAYIYVDRAAGSLYTCMPNATHYQGVTTALRPPEWPGPQLAGPPIPSAPGCQQHLNASGYDAATGTYVPALSRCYSATGLYINTATYGYYIDPVSGLPVPDGYRIIYTNVTFLCKDLLAEACVRDFGPYGCWLRYCQSILAGSSYCNGPWPPPPAAAAAAGAGASGAPGEAGSVVGRVQ